MGNSYSNLGNYVRKLLSDDAALKAFLVDPIGEAEGKNGLTKAERAVLRRTVFHLSNNSKNGYSLERHLGSYRRSLRLLQNVLDNYGSKAVMDHQKASRDADDSSYDYTIEVYYPDVSKDTDYTCKTNDDVNDDGGPYAEKNSYTVSLSSDSATIEEVLLEVNKENADFIFESVSVNGSEYVSAFKIDGLEVSADISNSCYDLAENPDADYTFWFYTINGKPNQGGIPGGEGESFANYTLSSGDTVYWQMIAPDKAYGFQPCT